MFDRPRRNEHSYWDNKEPITDINEALSFLSHQGSSSDPIHLARHRRPGGEVWELVKPWYAEGDSGGDTSGLDYYQIDPALAQRLVAERLVVPHVVKYWGGSYEENDKLVISSAARERDRNFEHEQLGAAEKFLTPGIHTDLTGKPKRVAWGRDHHWYGRLYADYEMPDGRRCRVYPEKGEVVVPPPD